MIRIKDGQTDMFAFVKRDFLNNDAIDLGSIGILKTLLITKKGFEITNLSELNNKTVCIVHGVDTSKMIPKDIKFNRFDGRGDLNCLKISIAAKIVSFNGVLPNSYFL